MAFAGLDHQENMILQTQEEEILAALRGRIASHGDLITIKAWTDRAITQSSYDALIGSTLDGIVRVTDISVEDKRPPHVQMSLDQGHAVPSIGDYSTTVQGSVTLLGPWVPRAVALLRSMAWAGLSYMGYEIVTNEQAAKNVREVTGSVGSSFALPLLLLGGVYLISKS